MDKKKKGEKKEISLNCRVYPSPTVIPLYSERWSSLMNFLFDLVLIKLWRLGAR